MVECRRSLCRLLATLVCSMSVGQVVDASAVVVPYHPVLQVGQWHAVGEVSAAGPLPRSPTTPGVHDDGLGMPARCEHSLPSIILIRVIELVNQEVLMVASLRLSSSHTRYGWNR